MKLYVCFGTWRAGPRPGGHPCGRAHAALRQAGYEPEVIHAHGLGVLPRFFDRFSRRGEVERLSGNRWVPTLLLDDGTVVDGSQQIVDWAQANPAAAAPAA